MASAPRLEALDAALIPVAGTVSIWCGPLGHSAALTRLPDVEHYAASMMKVPVLAALYRAGAAGRLDLDAEVRIVNDFRSAKPGAGRYVNERREDQDDEVWELLGGTASLRWLARHMIVRSGNLATNVVLAHVGLPAVQDVLRLAGTDRMRVRRGIEDAAARTAGIDNVVTARDTAVLFSAIAAGTVGPAEDILGVLFAQEHREDLAAGLPPGTRVALKNGWVRGVRHAAGIVVPHDAPPYTLAVCTTTSLPDRDARRVIARIAAASWADRHEIGRW